MLFIMLLMMALIMLLMMMFKMSPMLIKMSHLDNKDQGEGEGDPDEKY